MNDSLGLDNESTNVAHTIFEKYGSGGSVNRRAMKGIMDDIYGLPLPSKEPISENALDHFYELLDLDNDGRISFLDIENLVNELRDPNTSKTSPIKEISKTEN